MKRKTFLASIVALVAAPFAVKAVTKKPVKIDSLDDIVFHYSKVDYRYFEIRRMHNFNRPKGRMLITPTQKDHGEDGMCTAVLGNFCAFEDGSTGLVMGIDRSVPFENVLSVFSVNRKRPKIKKGSMVFFYGSAMKEGSA